jgi:hypothetical protein
MLILSVVANVHMREQEKRKTGQLGLSKATKNGAVDYEHGACKGGSSQLCTKATIPSKKCARSCELGSQCRPNECIFGSRKPQGVGILEWGVYEPREGNGKLVYEQPGYKVDGSCHSKEGSK